MASGGAAIVGGIALFFMLIWFLLIAGIIFAVVVWIIMLIDVIQRKFKNENDKIMWILIVVLTGIIGAIIYYFMVKKPDKH